MSETLATVSATIFEVPSSSVSKLHYKVTLKNANGQAAPGAEVVINLTGDGSFAPNFRSDEIRRVMDDNGQATFIWYRASVYLRNCRATVTASAPSPDQSITLEQIEDPQGGVAINYVERPFKLPPNRV